MTVLARRTLLLGLAASMQGCAALSLLQGPAPSLPTFDLVPVSGRSGRRRAITLLVARPEAPAAIATDRILVKPDPLAVAYLPEARWADELQDLVQSLLIRSIAGTGRLGHVGVAEGGPVPDVVLLPRIDAFQAEPVAGQEGVAIRVAISVTLIRDSDQSLIASRDFAETSLAAADTPRVLVQAFQAALDPLLPALVDWTIGAI